MSQPHRGRFQAQGKSLEESTKWAQGEPLPAPRGHELLTELEEKLSESDRRRREAPFRQAHDFVRRAAESGGVEATDRPIKKSFFVRPIDGSNDRVDVEVLAGRAFVPQEDAA